MNLRIAAGSDNYNSQLLYFTSSSLSADDNKLVYISDMDGNPNIYVKDLSTGADKQLTYNKDGYLKSYVYFDGKPHKGLGKASIAFDHVNLIIYYLQGDDIRSVDLQGNGRTIATVPFGQVTAFTHVSLDGTRLCIPTTDERALEYDDLQDNNVPYNIDQRVQEENLNSYLRIYDTKTGEQILFEKVNKAWITHVQFHPLDNGTILYNHEWPWFGCGERRMWIFRGNKHIRIRKHEQVTSNGYLCDKDDWTCHEVWSHDGRYIVYHGEYAGGGYYIGRADSENEYSLTEIRLPENYTEYGHFTINKNGDLVSDGYYTDENNTAGYISLQNPDWQNCTIKWFPVCFHNSSWKSQDAHPHPIYNHKADKVYFTSDMGGTLKIYECDVQNLQSFL